MSMIGEYARLTPAELDRVVREPGRALEFVAKLERAEPDGGGDTAARRMDIDKAWDVLDFLLRRAGFPVDVVHGGEEVEGAGDWGYGSPRCFTPDRVRAAAAALAATPGTALVRDVPGEEVAAADLYPDAGGEHEHLLMYGVQHYEALRSFFGAAARDGDAMLVWLD